MELALAPVSAQLCTLPSKSSTSASEKLAHFPDAVVSRTFVASVAPTIAAPPSRRPAAMAQEAVICH